MLLLSSGLPAFTKLFPEFVILTSVCSYWEVLFFWASQLLMEFRMIFDSVSFWSSAITFMLIFEEVPAFSFVTY